MDKSKRSHTVKQMHTIKWWISLVKVSGAVMNHKSNFTKPFCAREIKSNAFAQLIHHNIQPHDKV